MPGALGVEGTTWQLLQQIPPSEETPLAAWPAGGVTPQLFLAFRESHLVTMAERLARTVAVMFSGRIWVTGARQAEILRTVIRE